MKSKKYKLLKCMDPLGDDPEAFYEAGRIDDVVENTTVIKIFYCKSAYSSFGYHMGLLPPGIFDMYSILVDDLYLPLLDNKPYVFEAMVMHELGHLISGSAEEDKRSDEQIRSERILNILKGKVAQEELEADKFAVDHCGKNAVMQMLDNTISTRKKRNTADGAIAIRELELRKSAVKRL